MKERIITGIIAAIVYLGLCLFGGYAYQTLLLVMALVGFYEFATMTKAAPFGAPAVIGYISVAYMLFPWTLMDLTPPLSVDHMIWIVMLLLLSITVITKNQQDIKLMALLFIGAFYIGTGFSYIAETRQAPDGHGLFWTFMLLCSIWASDIGAYFTGKTLGKNKLWPSISPNKTIEGAVGGIFFAMLAAVAFSIISPTLFHIGNALLIGLAAAVVGQMGDLIQSAYKRVYGIKDSGKILPGHGGILDRCDSWLMVFPFVHILMLMPF
ncbi:phosphatidate cytidylyltransferase [Paenibacillus sp. WLX2291]|uniref:phosphatidate cytidylyltransferase n=1 Tax=Paenibacillus sp. WLX2291 TaxID=3296934 RepID=UPI003984212B